MIKVVMWVLLIVPNDSNGSAPYAVSEYATRGACLRNGEWLNAHSVNIRKTICIPREEWR